MKKPTKKTVTDMIYSVDLEGTLDGLIEEMESLKSHWSNTYMRLFIEKEYDDEYTIHVLYGVREETDEELEKRLKQEAKIKAEQKVDKEKRKAQLIKEAKKLGLKVSE